MSHNVETTRIVTHRKTKQEVVASELRRAILHGDIHRSQRLYENEIAARFNVSRAPVREALRILQSEGLVKFTPRRGAVATHYSPDEIQELYEIRSVLEGMAGKLAADNISNEELDRLRHLVEQMDSILDNPSEYYLLNTQFHTILKKASRKEHLVEIINTLYIGTQYHFALALLNRKARNHWQLQHHKILQALEAKDSRRVESLIKKHVLYTAKVLSNYFRGL